MDGSIFVFVSNIHASSLTYLMKKNPTKERLIDTTAHLLQVKGYHGAGLNEILRLSNTPKGSLYHYFPQGKDELVVTALQQACKQIHLEVKELTESSIDFLDAMERIVDLFTQRLIQSDYSLSYPASNVTQEIAATHPNIRNICSGIYNEWEETISEIAKRFGYNTTDAHKMSQQFIAQLEGAMLLAKTHKNAQNLQYMLNHFTVKASN